MLISAFRSNGQTYCSPTFVNGCFSWSNHAITLDSINWVRDIYNCGASDYTFMSTTLNAGSSYTMDVMNGDWCGCGVWMDFNQDLDFDTTENLFYSYVANETNNYNFTIAIPVSVPTGTYRMRVIAGWGTDCFNVSANGYGACGSYQYGNFDDFTINIIGVSTGNNDAINGSVLLNVFPNPASTVVALNLGNNSTDGILLLSDLDGQLIQKQILNDCTQLLDISILPSGMYLLHYSDAARSQSIKLVKE